MVQTDPTQYTRECASWRENLRNYRSELTQYREKLQEVVSRQIPRNELPNIEHYDNQFEIQLRNINQLKHSIKEHERAALFTTTLNLTKGESLTTTHESLLDRYVSLQHTIQELKKEFSGFVSKVG
jgi:hypothetical protein